ncbi:MAG: hypothetical protein IT537_25375 [Hyphomicrobiales bacterium]|nr:hypothetical protein [Hyphomicrobiales bacterium]
MLSLAACASQDGPSQGGGPGHVTSPPQHFLGVSVSGSPPAIHVSDERLNVHGNDNVIFWDIAPGTNYTFPAQNGIRFTSQNDGDRRWRCNSPVAQGKRIMCRGGKSPGPGNPPIEYKYDVTLAGNPPVTPLDPFVVNR